VQLARTKSINQAHYEPGQVIVKQGERANHFYLVSDGEVEVVRQENGEEVTLAQLGKGEYFGEMELLSNSPRYASIRCLTPVDVISFSREDFGTLTGTWGQLTESLQEVADARAAMNIATLGKRPTADAS
jgi:NADH:ubiquinone reductase (H+-translocating)